ncbi:MAG: aldo/keto reductase [Methanobrevibacter sp.]|jgi:predicted aldo/keto reductase-like oxidoreductase|nr:aldo/keto reductase [Methanobrevibacter sp.]
MKYRELGKTGEKVSILGFGAMRLPTIDGENNKIDKKLSSDLLTYGIENGINYVDTAYPYHGLDFTGEGESERFLGEFFSENYREDVFLTTKMPSWMINEKEDMERIFERQLELLQTDYLNGYLIHSIKEDVWEKLLNLGVLDFLDDLKSQDKVKYIGFSFHDSYDLFKKVIEHYNWDMCQTQMNYLDENFQSGLKGLKKAKELGVGNIIMEPLRGGKLATNPPQYIKEIWEKSIIKRSPAHWAFKYLYNMEEVDIVLSGMNTLKDMKENIEIANSSNINELTKEEKELIKEVGEKYHENSGNNCNGCGYCMPCPFNVNIPDCFKEYNTALIFKEANDLDNHYELTIDKENRASNCTNCEICIEKCTQNLNIPEELKKVKKLFEG